MCTSAGFRLLIGLWTCSVIGKFVKSDSVEIVTPVTGIYGTSIAYTTSRAAIITPSTTDGRRLASDSQKAPSESERRKKPFQWPSNDTYVQAYMRLHRRIPSKRNDQYGTPEASYNTVIRSSFVSEDRYPSLTQDWTPSRPPSQAPESFRIRPTATAHGFHVPCNHHEYAQWQSKPHSYTPFSSSSETFGFLPKKLSLKLLFKIILKLVLFKMIVKFIAVICLLLFFPAIKSKETNGAMDDDEMRKLKKFNDATRVVWDSLLNKNYQYEYEDEYSEEEEGGKKEEDEELKRIKEIADLADSDPPVTGASRAVGFLRTCVEAVERVVGYMLRHFKRDNDNLHSGGQHLLEQIQSMLSSATKKRT